MIKRIRDTLVLPGARAPEKKIASKCVERRVRLNGINGELGEFKGFRLSLRHLLLTSAYANAR